MMFFLFQPREQTQINSIETPSLELSNFTVSELNRYGLISSVHGEKGIKYTDRYEIKNLNYTNNSSEYISNIKANTATYKEPSLDLEGDIKYFREDGLNFITQKASYDRETNIILSTKDFISKINKNTFHGSFLEYDIVNSIIESKNVTANYQLKERE